MNGFGWSASARALRTVKQADPEGAAAVRRYAIGNAWQVVDEDV